MKIISWCTDIHLDCAEDPEGSTKKLAYASADADCIVITGDISISPAICTHLKLLDEVIQKPIYFVLGNHDFYFSDFVTTRKKVVDTCRSSSFLCYLSNLPFVRLDQNTALVGHDGWYDAGNGDPAISQFVMNDWIRIRDYLPAHRQLMGGINIDKRQIVNIARSVCSEGVKHVADGIKAAVRDNNETIVVVTHVPPFAESCKPSETKPMRLQDALPWYTSKMMGDMLLRAAQSLPHVKFIVLSGHVHSQYKGNILPNLEVRVGKSEYGTPQLAGIIPI